NQLNVNLPDTASQRGGHLIFRDEGTLAVPNSEAHNWAAAVGSSLKPSAVETGADYRGPQDPAVICPASGPNAPTQPPRCDDTDYGKGAGGQLSYQVKLRAGVERTVWFGVGGSTSGVAHARAELRAALADPAGALASKVSSREKVDAASDVSLP